MKRLPLALLVLFASWASCQKSDSDSVVLVDVDATSGLVGITQLQATVTLGGLSTSEDFPKTNAGVTITFPTSFSLSMPRSRQGTLAVGITAVDASGSPVASGQDAKPVVVGNQTTLSIVLQAIGPNPGKDASAAPDSAPDVLSRDSGAGGVIGAGGATATGGVVGSGGMVGSGGFVASGGATTAGSGGKTGGGGITGSGGIGTTTTITSSGGISGSGGTPGKGGTTSSGGTTTTPTGGTTTSGTKNSGTTVTIVSGKATGAMTGFGWVALGSADSITDPTCGATKAAITSATPCAAAPNWSSTSALCITGSTPALSSSPTSAEYSANYGVVIGVNAGDAGGTGDPSLVLGQAFTSITIAATGLPTSTVRAQVHVKGDPDGTSYCMTYSASAMTLANFATDCYNTAPTGKIAAASIANIDKVSLEAVSGSAPVTVTSMCIAGITFAK